MNPKRLIRLCSLAIIALSLLSVGASAQQKTAKECNAEWTANKTDIQASGKTKKQFMADCRAEPASATTTPATPQKPAQQKTAKECNAEWTANKADIQASGKTKKQFVAECRAEPASAAPGAPAAPAASTTASKPAPAPAAPPKPTSAPASAPATSTAKPGAATGPLGANQFSTETQAKSHCPSDTVVWVNLESKIYHYSSNKNYGNTKSGAYMCEGDTAAAGFRAAKNEKHP
ncbi:MAG TPA: hypothetical protein VLX09_25045 [Stellaceae bacterium]|nr:hypothetical protein [Stellaceae bacterium]